MKTTQIMTAAVLMVGSGLALFAAHAQQAGIKRTDLQRHDLSVPGREVVQVIVELAAANLIGARQVGKANLARQVAAQSSHSLIDRYPSH